MTNDSDAEDVAMAFADVAAVLVHAVSVNKGRSSSSLFIRSASDLICLVK